MIVTVTPSPAIDWTVACDGVQIGAVNRAETAAREPSGKGINVALALHRAGIDTLAIVPLGGPTGELFRTLIEHEGVALRDIVIDADCRQNVTLREASGVDTKINFPGAVLTVEEQRALTQSVADSLSPGDLLVVAGSLPPGMPAEFFGELVTLGHESQARVILDTSGPALSAALEAEPDLVTPNREELAEALGSDVRTLADVERGAEQMRDRGARAVLTSLGAHGAYYQDSSSRVYGYVSGVQPVNSVGAGDALLAGMIAEDTDPEVSLTRALLWGSAAVESPTTLFLVDSDASHQVHVTSVIEPSLSLQ